jgi:hypothetical protein
MGTHQNGQSRFSRTDHEMTTEHDDTMTARYIAPSDACARLQQHPAHRHNLHLRRALKLAEHMRDNRTILVGDALDTLHPHGTPAARTRSLLRFVVAIAHIDVPVNLRIEGHKQLGHRRWIGFIDRRTS